MNRKSNKSNFRITELRLQNTVRFEFDDWTVTGLSLEKSLVQIKRFQGPEILERIVDFEKLQPVPLWDAQTMLNIHIMQDLGFKAIDVWSFSRDHVHVTNRFPATDHALFTTAHESRKIWFRHELENLLSDHDLCYFTKFPSVPNFF